MFAVEVGNELGVVRSSDLHEAVDDADLVGMPNDLLIFKRRERPVDLRMPAGLEDRHVLVHDGDVDGIAERLMNPV